MKSLESESILLQSHMSKVPSQTRQEEWLSHFKLFTDTDRDSTVYGLLNQ